ncbi:Uncharacterized protein BP5553_04377 [Venustampulla echinocandica]|uniref:Uncharacterized protein n=1 Tax=Venustampulla echinocandica TaxID=2656787 RepID=A0A370TN50_9HELO|nr:Uncharacterized protein BP5553_04377 [Venustampulla echinocandica]RDL36944.1 Uncharacterized protein BP5553_04377 [Venustampulla echinocandica]
MADVRSLLKSERAARRIQHKYASYSTTGTLLCVVCHLQLKSESLWDGHLRSAGHIMRLEKLQLQASEQEQEQEGEQRPEEQAERVRPSDDNKKKRKASSNEEDTIRKRGRPANGLPGNFFDPATVPSESRVVRPMNEIQIPSRPATPLKASPGSGQPTVDEDEWAAFEADIAAAELPAAVDAVISAPAMSTADLVAQSTEESSKQRKAREEAEVEGDKEDAERKLEDEFDRMEGLEARVRRLRERREALRKMDMAVKNPTTQTKPLGTIGGINNEDKDDEDEGDEDEWDGFRMKW